MEATFEQSRDHVRNLAKDFLAELPEGLTDDERAGFIDRISRAFVGAEQWVFVMYDKGFRLHENLSVPIGMRESRQEFLLYLNHLGNHLADGPKEIANAKKLVNLSGNKRVEFGCFASLNIYKRRYF